MSQPPVFLIGPLRAGTTVTRLMLNHHPEIHWFGEFDYAVDQVSDEGPLPDAAAYRDTLATHRIFLARNFDVDPTLEYRALVDSFVRQERERSGKPIVGATVHRHFTRLLRLWPDARFIHICRDPRDVARSWIGMGWAGTVWTGAHGWADAEREWDRLRGRLSSAQYVEISYESLIRQPEESLRRVCEFLDVEFSEQMLEYNEASTYGKPDPSLTEQWRRKLNDRQLGLVEGICGELMASRGYEPSGAAMRRPSRLSRLGFAAADRIARLRFRIRRLGVWLTLQSAIARRVPWPGWQRRVQMRINAVNILHLK